MEDLLQDLAEGKDLSEAHGYTGGAALSERRHGRRYFSKRSLYDA